MARLDLLMQVRWQTVVRFFDDTCPNPAMTQVVDDGYRSEGRR